VGKRIEIAITERITREGKKVKRRRALNLARGIVNLRRMRKGNLIAILKLNSSNALIDKTT